MSAYASEPMAPHQDNHHPTNYIPHYPQLPPSPGSQQKAPQAYMNVDPQLNHGLGQMQVQPQTQSHPQTQVQTQTRTPSKSKKKDNTEAGKARLQKACDSCSVRKVKCDESGPPCKACVGLNIPCTYERESKRRGPPNRHAENLKKRRFEMDGGAGMSHPSSPHQTAQTLAAFAQQAVLSAEAICPLPLIRSLVDDYFTYIHPVVPVPHKQSFMHALDQREDVHNATFLALLASMLGCLVASFPRRPRQHFRHYRLESQFPTPMNFISRCQQITLQALGTGHLLRQLSIHDAIISYLQGLTAVYTYDRHSTLIYFKQCLSIMSTIGVHKAKEFSSRPAGAPPARMVPNGHVLEGPQPGEVVDCIDQELRKRTFWLMFVSVRSIRMVGVSDWELLIPPATKPQPYPPLPVEVDDEYLTPDHILPQPRETISELTGFNANVQVYTVLNDTATYELIYGTDQLFDWDLQKRSLEKALHDVKRVCEGLPPELSLNLKAPQPQPDNQEYPSPARGLAGPQEMNYYASNGSGQRPMNYGRAHDEMRIQYEIQKANIHVSHLATRMYLVEKYWTYVDARNHPDPNTTTPSPNIIPPSLDQSNAPSMTEQDFTTEREEIVQSTLHFLNSVSQLNMEPNGKSLIGKLRQISRTLLDKPRTHTGDLGAIAEADLQTFVGFMARLEGGGGVEEDEEGMLRGWADMKKYQVRFHESGGFSPP